MILCLTRITAALVGENPAEWHLVERQVRAGRWTTSARSEEGRLRQVAGELGVPLREDGVVPNARLGGGPSRRICQRSFRPRVSRSSEAVIQERRPDETAVTRAILDGHPVDAAASRSASPTSDTQDSDDPAG